MCKWSLLIDSAISYGDHTSLHSHSASCLHPPNLKRSKTPFTFPPFRAVPVVARSALGSERSSPSPLSSSDPSATAPSPAPSPHPVPSLAPSPVPAALGALRREGQPAGFGRHRRRRPRALLVGRPLCAARRCCKRGLRHPQRLGGWEWGWTIALRPPKEHETWPWLCGLKLFGEAVYSKSFRCSSLCCSCVFVCKLNFASYSISSGCLGRTGSELPLLMSNEFHLVMFHSPMLFVHLWCRTRAAVQEWYSPHEQPCEPPKKTATYFDLGSDTWPYACKQHVPPHFLIFLSKQS